MYRFSFPALIDAICEWETLSSLTIFYLNRPQSIFPKILDDNSTTMFDAQDLGHPLLAEKQRIGNDFSIQKKNLFIITGANMAGKSTFLRTVGINIILARMGAPVCASSFQCMLVSPFTSMRTIDDLGNGISYFYAEALRIKEMLDFVEKEKNVLLIIDELFRGTNSEDRLKSSRSFIKRLTRYTHIASLIATHDIGITDLEETYPNQIQNYCFECFNRDDQIVFDYKLKSGITQSNNAHLLLQKMKIID